MTNNDVRKLVERLTDAANDPTTLTGTSVIFRQASRLLTEVWQQYVDANEARIDAEAQLAEALKALDAIIERSSNDFLDISKVNDMRRIAEGAIHRIREGGK